MASKNGSKSSPKGAKWRPKSILEPSWEAKLKTRCFLMPRGRLKDLSCGAIWESKIVPNPFWKRCEDACDLEQRFATVLNYFSDHFLKLILKPLRDKMRGRSDMSEEVKMFQNINVFTVRLHLCNVDNARTKLARTMFFLL